MQLSIICVMSLCSAIHACAAVKVSAADVLWALPMLACLLGQVGPGVSVCAAAQVVKKDQ